MSSNLLTFALDSSMSVISQDFERVVAQADFASIRQFIVDLIVKKQGLTFLREISQSEDLSNVVSRFLPMLQRWDQEQLAASGLNRVQML